MIFSYLAGNVFPDEVFPCGVLEDVCFRWRGGNGLCVFKIKVRRETGTEATEAVRSLILQGWSCIFFLSWWFRQGVIMLWFTLLKLHPLGERVWGLDLEGVCWVWDSSSYPGYNLKENGKSRLSLKKSSQTVVTLDIWQKKKKGIKVFITRNWVNVDTT